MTNKRWLGELKVRCEMFTNKNTQVDSESIEQRDRLIQFANLVVEKQLVSRLEALELIDNVDRTFFEAA